MNSNDTLDPAVTTGSVISSDKVEGSKVYNAEGDKLGTIDCLMIDKLSGNVRYAVMEFGGFMGMNTDRYPLPWSMLKYEVRHDGYVVPLTKERLTDAPRYPHDTVPHYNDEYTGTVDRYYGT